MRTALLAALFLCACSAARVNSDGQTIRNSDPTPAAALAAVPHAVTVYVEATCGHLEKATAHGTGFWITPRIVVTAGHAMSARTQMFPDFALVGSDGSCVDGQYGDWQEAVDLMFILARGRHEGHLTLDKRLPAAGEFAYQVSYESLDSSSGAALFSRRRVKIEDLPGSKVYFAAKPIPREGDSGSPLIEPDGKVIGMAMAIGSYKDEPDKPKIGVYLTSLTISYFLGQCGPCEEE